MCSLKHVQDGAAAGARSSDAHTPARRRSPEKIRCSGPMGLRYSLFTEGPGRWRLHGCDLAGVRQRRALSVPSLAEAKAEAERFLLGEDHRESAHPSLTVEGAISRALDARVCQPVTRAHWDQFTGYFCDWCRGQGVSHWHQVRLETVQRYLHSLIDRGLRRKTISHYLEPVRLASAWLAANWPEHYRDVAAPIRVPRDVGEKSEYSEDEGAPVLLIPDLLAFLDWLDDHSSAGVLRPGVALQGLCGLQMQEALRLRWRSVDLDAGTVTIEGEVKNRWRRRRIPICRAALEILNGHRSVQAHPDSLVVPAKGRQPKAYGKLVRTALRSWRPGIRLAPKDLRNTIPTAAIEDGWNDYLTRRYIGHAAKTIAERHYFGDEGKRMLALYRTEIVARLDALIAETHKRGDI